LAAKGDLSLLYSVTKLALPCYRVAFLASGLSSGWLKALGSGPQSLDSLVAKFGVDRSMADGLQAWLRLGVALGELRVDSQGYSLRGNLARKLIDPENDAASALIEETATLDIGVIERAPTRLRQRRPFTLAEQDARLVARSSRFAEPFICEAVDEAVPRRSPFRLLEIGCGSAAYIRHAALRNPLLTALGLELQPEAAALASENVSKWNLTSRVRIEVGDVRLRSPEPSFDLATLHQNIYYFPVARRVEVLQHVRGFLKPGGSLLLTTWCQGKGVGSGLLDLWASMTDSAGRLPQPAEMAAQIREAGFKKVSKRTLIPGQGFCSFLAG
jgi:SAM-dependent methyltransferase